MQQTLSNLGTINASLVKTQLQNALHLTHQDQPANVIALAATSPSTPENNNYRFPYEDALLGVKTQYTPLFLLFQQNFMFWLIYQQISSI